MQQSHHANLSAAEIDVYFRALVSYAGRDGVHEAERAYITSQAQVLGYDVALLWENVFSPPAFDSLTSTIRKIILRDAIVLAHLDGQFSQNEAAGLRELCIEMRLDLSVLDDIETWLDEYARLLERARDLFG